MHKYHNDSQHQGKLPYLGNSSDSY